MNLLDLVFQPIVAFLMRRIVAEAEVQTAIRCAESLQQAYARADELEAAGYQNLANELRQQADAVDISRPGVSAMEYVAALEVRNPATGEKGSEVDATPLALTQDANSDRSSKETLPAKRGRGRPRKHPK